MRPELLFPIYTPVRSLPGVGPRLSMMIEKLVGPNLVDLCFHLPNGFVDRRYSPSIVDAVPGSIATIRVEVLEHLPPKIRRLPYRVSCKDDSGVMELVFFHARKDYIEKILPVGQTRIVSGKVEHFKGNVQMSHPDHIVKASDVEDFLTVEPVYPLTAGLTAKPLTKAIKNSIKMAVPLPEWQDPAWLNKNKSPSWLEALHKVHEPENEDDLSPLAPSRKRLAFDELLADQLALSIVRRTHRRKAGRAITKHTELVEEAITSLPFRLTNSQTNSLDEILKDMAEPLRMLRLLQGDVGSGKTVVAFLAMLRAVEIGAQGALMAPTEVLARQHYKTISELAKGVGVSVCILTGRDKGKIREKLLSSIAGGEISIVIGTHTLFQKDIKFNDLALAVIDEQHRFGVHQRLMLTDKGKAADMLVMTATPIPRTLMLCAYSDLDSSRLTDNPSGRKPIETRALSNSRLEEVVARLEASVHEDCKAFWVCPLVEESELIDIQAATDRYAYLNRRFPNRVGLIHGKMKGAEKDKVMSSFSSGGFDILVATTVIEVGVDIPEASIMVIEHAERFGLSQLHQLRGRVGRSKRKSSCLLLYAPPLGEIARARLNVLRETDDGFLIAEEDLKLRGAGEMLGTRQSGLPVYKVADITKHQELMMAARDDARLIIERDPGLTSERGKALRILLYLFSKDSVVQTLRSG